MPRTALVPRRATSAIVEALADTRVVLVNGARQAGKSTLGVVFYTGDTTLPFGPKLRAMPVSALWQLH